MGIVDLFKSAVVDGISKITQEYTWKNNVFGDGAGIQTFTYPNELTKPQYQFKKLTIYVWKSKVINDALVSKEYKSRNSMSSNSSTITWDSVKDKIGDIGNNFIDFGKTITSDGSMLESFKNLSNNIGDLTKFDDFEGAEAECCFVLPLPLSLMEQTSHSFSATDGAISTSLDILNGPANKLQAMIARKNSQKIMPNPDKFQNYQGSDPRDYDLVFKMIPSSSEEAAHISNIVFNIKKFASPEVDDGAQNLTMIQPRFFSMVFGNPVLNELIRPLPFVISNITMTYDDGTYVSTTLDGMPKSITLSLRISEIRTMNKRDFEGDTPSSSSTASPGIVAGGFGAAL